MTKVNVDQLPQEFCDGARELLQDLQFEQNEFGVVLKAEKIDRGISVKRDHEMVLIQFGRKQEFFRGLRILKDNIKKKNFHIKQVCSVDELGFMADNSRNAVLKVEAVKKLIRKLALLGYTSLQLYTEDTYEVENEPYFGYLRGRYSQEELKKMDCYAGLFGIELIPCIQTLAHLNAITRWVPYHGIVDCNDILLAEEERTYELISNMFASLAQCFTSRKINIGMDEAHMLGLGKYLDKHGYRDRIDIMTKHLQKVMQLCRQYGFQPMMWSDMFFRLAFQGDYYKTDAEIPKEIREKIPQEVSLVYWDYYSTDKARYDLMFRKHLQFDNQIIFAGGAWKWIGFAPDNRYSFAIADSALSSCIQNGIRNVFVTAWGDNGGECSVFSVLPTLVHYSETVYRVDNEQEESAFQTVAGCSRSDFMALDLPNRLSDAVDPHEINNSCKYLLYNDCFLGVMDSLVTADEKEMYRGHIEKLKKAERSKTEWCYLFKTLRCLCEVLEIKIDLGIRTRELYSRKDKAALAQLAKEDYTLLVKKIQKFYHAFREQWYSENKPHGFDVQDLRLGGLIQRLRSCRDRLLQYAGGQISQIEELEEKILDFYGNVDDFTTNRITIYNSWSLNSSVNTNN